MKMSSSGRGELGPVADANCMTRRDVLALVALGLVAGCPRTVSAVRIPRGQPRNRSRLGVVKGIGRSSHASAPILL
jgi:hypothetical protein